MKKTVYDAPRTSAYRHVSTSIKLFIMSGFEGKGDPDEDLKATIYGKLALINFTRQKTAERSELMHRRVANIVAYGWSPKQAYKIASGHWNDNNHPSIEYGYCDWWW